MKLQFNKYKKNGNPVNYFLDVIQENGEAKEYCLPYPMNLDSSLEWDELKQQFKENQPESEEANQRLKTIDYIVMQVFKEQFANENGRLDAFEFRNFKYMVKKKEELYFNEKNSA